MGERVETAATPVFSEVSGFTPSRPPSIATSTSSVVSRRVAHLESQMATAREERRRLELQQQQIDVERRERLLREELQQVMEDDANTLIEGYSTPPAPGTPTNVANAAVVNAQDVFLHHSSIGCPPPRQHHESVSWKDERLSVLRRGPLQRRPLGLRRPWYNQRLWRNLWTWNTP